MTPHAVATLRVLDRFLEEDTTTEKQAYGNFTSQMYRCLFPGKKEDEILNGVQVAWRAMQARCTSDREHGLIQKYIVETQAEDLRSIACKVWHVARNFSSVLVSNWRQEVAPRVWPRYQNLLDSHELRET